MEKCVESIITGNSETFTEFVKIASDLFTFPELDQNNKRKELWSAFYNIACNTEDNQKLTDCFSAIRILSRDKILLSEVVTDEWLELIKKHSGLNNEQFQFDSDKEMVAVEAQKSLCNIVFNSRKVASKCCENGILESITNRLKRFKDDTLPVDIKFFDMKLLFLLTALCPEIRLKMINEMHGLVYLIEALELILQQAAANVPHNSDNPTICLNDKQVDTACEILKALFNLTIRLEEEGEEEQDKCPNMVNLLRMFLLMPTSSKDKTLLLQNHVIHLLNNMPENTFKNLITPIQPNQNISQKLQFDGQNMTAFYEILLFLQDKFSDKPTVSKQHEVLSPVVSVLLKCANSERSIRKYLRSQVLPPLKDVHNRPEQGNTLRNYLCRLLTTPITPLRNLVAELLFVLCKKNVNRMIKYTGYGNAAGLFAQRGLLGGRSDEGEADYSSDSQDSETEEYAEYKHGINPVLGCYEAPHPSAMENMTEEQKEYEAMKLVELMDNLTKCGAIKPCRVGADGKPHPIEHVLQLQENLQTQQINSNVENSDCEE